jgi:hypothetical protein
VPKDIDEPLVEERPPAIEEAGEEQPATEVSSTETNTEEPEPALDSTMDDAVDAPSTNLPVDETPVEETPVEQTPVEETPVGETPVEETPVKETLVEETPVQETPVEETPSGETPIEPVVEPETEWPTATKKMSKKEKKKAAAAAAAAAAALESEQSVEPKPEPTVDEPSAPSEEALDVSREVTALEDNQPEVEQQVESPSVESTEKEVIEPPTQETDETAEPIVEEPEQPEAQANTSEKEVQSELAIEEPSAEPITRKLSKKDKKKAKKLAKAEPSDLAATPTEELPKEDAPAGAVNEDVSANFAETSIEMAPEVVPDSELVRELQIAVTPEVQPEQHDIPAAIEPENLEVSEQAEDKDEELPVEQIDETTIHQTPSPEEQEQKKEEEETKFQSQALEKAADLEVAGLEDRLPEPESAAPLSKKLSKKEKRKSKKNEAVEEPVEESQEQSISEVPFTESKEEELPTTMPTPLPEVEPTVEPEPELQNEPQLESESTREIQSEPEVSKEIEPAIETPAAETETAAEATLVESVEPVTETPLSSKASKKKSKKAKKAAQALEEASPVKITEEYSAATPAQEESSRDLELSESTPQEKKPGDDEFPTIEWEHGHSPKPETFEAQSPEFHVKIPEPVPQTIEEYDESAIPVALQEAKEQSQEATEEEAWAAPLSKKDKKKAKKNKRKSEQASLAEPEAEEPLHKRVELATEFPEPPLDTVISKEIETQPPARTTTPGGSKIANLFPGLERGGFKRSALDNKTPSLKDSAEEETEVDMEANRDIVIPVSEAPQATLESREITESSRELPIPDEKALVEEPEPEPELPVHDERPMQSASKERSSLLFDSSPSTRTEDASTPRRLLPSQMEVPDLSPSPSGLRRTPSVIHGRHQQTPRTWTLDEESIPATSGPSPPRSLFGGPFGDHDTLSRPRTPLDPIAEQEPADWGKATMARSGTPRLEIKPEHVLPRPVTPVRKFTDNAIARERWPTPENEEKIRSQDSLKSGSGSGSGSGLSPLKTPEQGMPVLKPSGSKGKLRRMNRSTSSDLRAASRALDEDEDESESQLQSQPQSSQPPPNLDLDQLPSSSSYDPVNDKGKRPLRNMDVYVSFGLSPIVYANIPLFVY